MFGTVGVERLGGALGEVAGKISLVVRIFGRVLDDIPENNVSLVCFRRRRHQRAREFLYIFRRFDGVVLVWLPFDLASSLLAELCLHTGFSPNVRTHQGAANGSVAETKAGGDIQRQGGGVPLMNVLGSLKSAPGDSNCGGDPGCTQAAGHGARGGQCSVDVWSR